MLKYDEKEINKNYYKIKYNSHLEFSKEQENAILSAFTEPVIIITGETLVQVKRQLLKPLLKCI